MLLCILQADAADSLTLAPPLAWLACTGRCWRCDALWLQVPPDDTSGLALYTGAGFERIDVKGSWSDIIFGPKPFHLMRKELAPEAASTGA